MRIFILVWVFVFAVVACNRNGGASSEKEKKATLSADSIELVTDLIRNDSADFRLYLTRARLNLERGKIDPAFRDVNTALDLNPEAPEAFMLLSDLYFILGNLDNAFSALRKAAELDPANEIPYVKQAEAYLVIRNYSMAQKSADRALSINVNNADAYFLKGVAFIEQGDTASAITHLQISANLDTTKYEAYMQLASVYQQRGDTLAFDYYFSALKIHPDDEKALFGLARFYQDLGRYDEAIGYYGKVNQLYPLSKEAYFNKGYIYLVEEEDFDRAAAAFQQAINIDPSYVKAVYNLGRTYEAQGLYDEAAVKYRQALELHTNYSLAIEGLNRMGK